MGITRRVFLHRSLGVGVASSLGLCSSGAQVIEVRGKYPSLRTPETPDQPFVNVRVEPNTTSGSRELLDKALSDNLIYDSYAFDGIYHDLAASNILKNRVVSYDEQLGIPVNLYTGMDKPVPYPVTIGIYALESASKYFKSGEADYRERLWHVRDWILDNQNDQGCWTSEFKHEFFTGRSGGPMPSGWVSALAQGFCISALVRCQAIEPDPVVAKAIAKALWPYSKLVEDGGVLRLFRNRYWFYEEYPTIRPSFVLNGFMFALLGLYDAWKSLNDETAFLLYQQGLDTLEVLLPHYDLGDRTSYDLTHLQTGNETLPPNPAREGYHLTHLRGLSSLNALENGRFERVMERWVMYYYGVITPTN